MHACPYYLGRKRRKRDKSAKFTQQDDVRCLDSRCMSACSRQLHESTSTESVLDLDPSKKKSRDIDLVCYRYCWKSVSPEGGLQTWVEIRRHLIHLRSRATCRGFGPAPRCCPNDASTSRKGAAIRCSCECCLTQMCSLPLCVCVCSA